MIIWTIKLMGTVRSAIAGRKYPHQMAWAVAFGLLLGMVPHGNLLALVILIGVVSLKINHAMAALTAVGATFAAALLDPFSHRVGEIVLTHPRGADLAAAAWGLPLVPWTDLNNTVVMGSFLIGVAALVPVFAITYPIFRWLAPAISGDPNPSDGRSEQAGNDRRATHDIVVIDQGHLQAAKPHRIAKPAVPQGNPNRPQGKPEHRRVDPGRQTAKNDRVMTRGQGDVAAAAGSTDSDVKLDGAAVDQPASSEAVQTPSDVVVETRIDVIRMKDYRDSKSQPLPEQTAAPQGDPATPQQPMDEALNYLLRQLRDSQQRKVA